jgi:glutamyl-tRNA reductase
MAAEHAERLVAEHAAGLARQQAGEAMTPVIVALRERTRSVLLGELDRSLRGKLRHLEPGERAALRTMLEAAANKLMHEPSIQLKSRALGPAAPADAALVRALFGLEPSPLDAPGRARPAHAPTAGGSLHDVLLAVASAAGTYTP